jgi:hypothetical protein
VALDDDLTAAYERRVPGRSIHMEGTRMKDGQFNLSLEVEEIESRERGGGCSTSSSTSRLCTCACRYTTTLVTQTKS